MEYQNKNLIIMTFLILDISFTYESDQEIGSDGEVYTSDGFYEGIEIPKPVKADLRKNYGPDGSMRQGANPGTGPPQGYTGYTKGPKDGSPVGAAGILPGYKSETDSGSNENAFPGHIILPGGSPKGPDYYDMNNGTSNSTIIDPKTLNGPDTKDTPDEKLPEGEQDFKPEESFSGKISTLKPLPEERPCAECPDVYLPVCANVSGVLLSYQNVCYFVCLKLKNAYVIRRGNCVYFRRSLN